MADNLLMGPSMQTKELATPDCADWNDERKQANTPFSVWLEAATRTPLLLGLALEGRAEDRYSTPQISMLVSGCSTLSGLRAHCCRCL